MGFNLVLKSSGGEFDGNVPFRAADTYTMDTINARITASPNSAGGYISQRFIWSNDRVLCEYLESFYMGAAVISVFPLHTIRNTYMHPFFMVDLYDENEVATGYKIVTGPTCSDGSSRTGGVTTAVYNSNNEYVTIVASAGALDGHDNNNKVSYFIWERPDGNIIFGSTIAAIYHNNVVDLSVSYVSINGFANSSTFNIYGKNVETALMSEEFGTPSEEGGYTGGTFDDSSDTIAIPTMPTIGVTSAGFVNVYNPSVNALQGFGAELFPDLTFSGSSHISGSLSVADAIEAAANALVDLGNQIPNIVNMYINSNLINYVIDCHILPVAPTIGGASNIKVGFKQFTASAPVVTSDYVDFDCGTLNVGEYYANFIDYSPYTRARLFLPLVGFVDLQPEFLQSGSVNIVYRFNIIDGSFMCYVLSTSSKSKLTNSVIMQFGGNACVHIPITGLNYSSMVSGVVGGTASMVASQAGVSGLNQRAGSAITSAITSAVDVAQSKPPVQASNGYNATTSFLSVRTPYLLIERSVSNFSIAYTEEKGVPSNITSDFASLTGFTQATAVHLDGISATEEEKAEIAALLAQGVIL